MTNIQEITILENKINHIQTTIDNYRTKLTDHENTLMTLTQQLTQIKQQVNTKK